MEALNAQLTAASSEAITAGGDKIRAEGELRRIEAAISQAQAAAQLRAAECEQLNETIRGSRKELEEAKAEESRLGEQIAALEAELAELAGSDDSFLATRARLSDELSETRLARLAAEKDVSLHEASIRDLESRHGESNEEHEQSIRAIQEEKEKSAGRIREAEEAIRKAAEERMQKEGSISRESQRQRAVSDEREKMSQEMARLNERKAAAEKEYDELIAKLWEEYQLTMSDAQPLCVPFESAADLRRQVAETRGRIRALGNVNVGAIEEYKEVSERYTFLNNQVQDVEKSRAELTRMIGELSAEMQDIFTRSFAEINRNFGRIFTELFGGGTACLKLDDELNVLESGIEIQVSPPGKVIKNLAALSGGEQALVAISIYFAILAVNPAPFCILDEIEAALDDVNVARYAQYLRRITDHTQFIVITHRRGTMEAADVLYGVTMQEDGVSKLLRLDLEQVDATLVS